MNFFVTGVTTINSIRNGSRVISSTSNDHTKGQTGLVAVSSNGRTGYSTVDAYPAAADPMSDFFPPSSAESASGKPQHSYFTIDRLIYI